MTFINKDGKLFGKISIIDAFVLLAIVVLLIGIYVRVISPSAGRPTISQEIEYEMLVRAIRLPSVRALQNAVIQEPAGFISDSRTGEDLGAIIDMRLDMRGDTTLAIWEGVMSDGEVVSRGVPDRFDVIVTVRVDGRISETGYFTHQNRALAVGSHINFQSRYSDTSGEILTIRRIEVEAEEVVDAEE